MWPSSSTWTNKDLLVEKDFKLPRNIFREAADFRRVHNVGVGQPQSIFNLQSSWRYHQPNNTVLNKKADNERKTDGTKVKARRGRPLKRERVNRKGHCACCTCTHSESPSPSRARLADTKTSLTDQVEDVPIDFTTKVKIEEDPLLISSFNESPLDQEENNNEFHSMKNEQDSIEEPVVPETAEISSLKYSNALELLQTTYESDDDADESMVNDDETVEHTTSGNSIYKYSGDLIILCKNDFKNERRKDFCFFCKNLFCDIKTHLEKVHSNKAEVEFVRKMTNAKNRNISWKLLTNMGNNLHNNNRAFHTGKGFIIPSMLSTSKRKLSDMTCCPSCKAWIGMASLYLHKMSCPEQLWKDLFGREQNTEKNRLNVKRKKTTRPVLVDADKDFLDKDEICSQYLKQLKSRGFSNEKIAAYANKIIEFFKLVKLQMPDTTNKMLDIFNFGKVTSIATTIRRMSVSPNKRSINQDSINEISDILLDLMLEAFTYYTSLDDEEMARYTQKFGDLLMSDKWKTTIRKPL